MGTNLNSNLEVLFSKMENFVASKTVVGDPIHIDNIIIIPLIDISLGVGASASDNNSKKENGMGGLGAKITPSSVLVIQDGSVQLISIKNHDSISKLIDMVPGVLSKLNLNNKKND
jgi:Uncharacterized conserved protein